MLNMNYDTPNKNTLFDRFQYDTSADILSNDTNITQKNISFILLFAKQSKSTKLQNSLYQSRT
jgi:hypothetical protein